MHFSIHSSIHSSIPPPFLHPPQLNLTRQSDQVQLILPILHDPKSNNNYVARRTNLPKVELPSALQVIDQTLRKPSQEWNIPPNESSLAYCIQYLLNVNLPV